MRVGQLIVVLSAIAGSCAPALAQRVVEFSDGRSMRVEEVERIDDQARLLLEGGGEISVPAERIENWDALGLPIERRSVLSEPLPELAGWRLAAGEYADLIAQSAEEHDLDPALLTSMARVESAFDRMAVSPKGASGLLQLMPGTADRFGVADVFDAAENIDAGARYMSWLLERYSGQTDLALAGYNAGEGAVDRYSGIPPFRETRQYVRRVMVGVAELAP